MSATDGEYWWLYLPSEEEVRAWVADHFASVAVHLAPEGVIPTDEQIEQWHWPLGPGGSLRGPKGD